jgi:hypothetical protein
MADFFKGLAGGMQTGLQFGQAMRQRRMEDDLAQAYAKPEEFTDYTPEQQRQIRELQASGAYDVSAIPGAEGAAPTLRYAPRQGLDLQGDMPAVEGAYIDVAPQQVQRYGGQTTAGRFDPTQLRGLQMQEASRVLGSYGDVRGAAALQAQAAEQEFQAKYRPLQLESMQGQIAGEAQQRDVRAAQLRGIVRAEDKEVGFDGAITTINKTEYKTPAEKNAAILSAVSQFKGPEAAIALEKNYNDIERDQLVKDGLRFDQKIKQARLKGPAAALQAIDELNDSFTLEIDGFKVTQVNKDGSRVPFLEAKTADEFALSVDSRIRDGGAFELAKFRQDEKSKNALAAYYAAKTKEANAASGAAANQLTGVTIGYSRDDKTGQPIQVMSGLRFNKKTGALESVQVKLGQNVVPPSALDPKKIADQAEALVGQPIDPTNKKSKDVHTFATAQQAVVDQIFNQYLGTGKPAGGLDLSPAAVAQRMLQGNAPTTPAASAPATLQPPTNLGIDPNRPQSNLSPVSGLPRGEPGSGPNLVKAVTEGLDAGRARYVKYLQSKIADNKIPLTVDEQIQAKRYGLQ